jgi:hypothetical protein
MIILKSAIAIQASSPAHQCHQLQFKQHIHYAQAARAVPARVALQAVSRGYNVLSIDTDMHLSANPLQLVRAPPYDSFSALMQLDSAWPVVGNREAQRATDERGQHVNVVPCLRQGAEAVLNTGSAEAARHGCPCGVVPAPLLNTGFVYVRAAATPMSAQQLICQGIEISNPSPPRLARSSHTSTSTLPYARTPPRDLGCPLFDG